MAQGFYLFQNVCALFDATILTYIFEPVTWEVNKKRRAGMLASAGSDRPVHVEYFSCNI